MTFGTFVVAVAMLNPASPGQDRDQSQEWLNALQVISSRLNVSIAFDIGPFSSPDDSLWKMGELGLDKLAQDTLRTRHEVEGVQVFVRRQPDSEGRLYVSSQRVLGVLRGVDAGTLEKLASDGLDLADLPEFVARELLVSLPMRMEDTMRAARGGGLRIALDIDSQFTFKNPKTNREVKGSLSASRFGKWFGQAGNGNAADLSPAVPRHWVGRISPSPDDGELDFGKGELLSLAEIVKKASEAFDTRYFFDLRLEDSTYFISGEYTQKRFEEVIDSLMKPVPLTESFLRQNDLSLSDLRKRLKRILMDIEVPYSNTGKFALENQSVLAGELGLSNSHFSQILKQLGLQSSTFEVFLEPMMTLAVFMPREKGQKHMGFRLRLGQLGR